MEKAITEIIHPGPELDREIAVSSASVRGTRMYQEDSLYYEPIKGGLLGAVMDGMGGLACGKEASQSAAKALAAYFKDHPFSILPDQTYWKDALAFLDRSVYEVGRHGETPQTLGTTVAAAYIRNGYLTWGTAGDSMIYLIRNGVLMDLVNCHNYQMILEKDQRNDEITPEEYAEEMDHAEELISYLGMNGLLFTDVAEEAIPLQKDDIVLICTDGLYRNLSAKEILNIINTVSGELFYMAAVYLIRAILNKPDKELDNISVIGFQYQKGES